MVGLQTLDLPIGVRVPASQPTYSSQFHTPIQRVISEFRAHVPVTHVVASAELVSWQDALDSVLRFRETLSLALRLLSSTRSRHVIWRLGNRIQFKPAAPGIIQYLEVIYEIVFASDIFAGNYERFPGSTLNRLEFQKLV